MFRYLLHLCLLILLLSSCHYLWDQPDSIVTNEINGTYIFKYPSGQVEVIYLQKDSTFKRMLYKNETHYVRKHNSQFLNEGTWRANGKAILFNDWMQYCYMMDPDSMLREPEMVESQYADLYQSEPSDVAIIIWENTSYILHKED